MSDPASPWSKQTQDRWFYGFLAVSAVAVVVLFLPYADALLFAATTVVVTWPVYERVVRHCGDRPVLASAITSLLILGLVLVPMTVLGLWFVSQATDFTQEVIRFVTSGDAQRALDEALKVVEFIGEDWVEDPAAEIMAPLRDGVLTLGQSLGTVVPALVGSVVGTTLDAAIYLFALVSLYIEGPKVARAIMQLSPMDDRYEERLFFVFREFSNNLVIGSLATAAIQGAVAGVGFALVGIEQVVFFSILTAIMSFLPVVGTALVWAPLVLYVGAVQGTGLAVLLAAWSIGLTGTVDNMVRPLFLRGSSNIHPLLIFVALLGGLNWMGFPGALVGPVLVAAFLALFKIYREDFLGIEPAPSDDAQPGIVERAGAILGNWLDRLLAPLRALLDPLGAPRAPADDDAED